MSSSCERQQSQVTGAFDSARHPSLMLGAEPRLASWPDLASILDVGQQNVNLLVVHIRYLAHTEGTLPWRLSAPTITTPTTPRSRRSLRAPCCLFSC